MSFGKYLWSIEKFSWSIFRKSRGIENAPREEGRDAAVLEFASTKNWNDYFDTKVVMLRGGNKGATGTGRRVSPSASLVR